VQWWSVPLFILTHRSGPFLRSNFHPTVGMVNDPQKDPTMNDFLKRPLLALVAFAAIALPMFLPTESADAQLFRRAFSSQAQCYGNNCAPAQTNTICDTESALQETANLEVNVSNWYTKFTGPGRQPTQAERELAEKAKFAAVRIYQGNGCGSGSLVGRDEKYIYLKTNAHVASTNIGTQSRCQAIVNGQLEQFPATLIEVAYSSRDRVDWGLLRADARFMRGIAPIPMAKTMPDPNAPTILWGHPRCVPTEGRSLVTVKMGTVWFKNANATGGESGSAVIQGVNGRPVQFGLTTWSELDGQVWRHSSQFTASIWKQSQNRTNKGEPRSGFEIIPQSIDANANPLGVELVDCYAAGGENGAEVVNASDNPLGVVLEEKWACIGDVREVALRDYPIWFDPSAVDPDPVDPVDPVDPKPCPNIDEPSRKKLQEALKLIQEILATTAA
jgi:hypothetical protein